MLRGVSRLFWVSLVASVVVLAAAGVWFFVIRPAAPVSGTELNNPVLVSGLDLVDHRGRVVDLADDFRGQVTLVFFGYTRCPDVCPLTMARLARAYRGLGEPAEVQVVMVTVDPAIDTAERLRAYVEGFHPTFLGLRGGNQEVAEAALRFYVGVNALGDGLVAHSDPVALLGPDRTMRLLYPQDRLAGLEEDLRAVLAGPAW